MSPEQSRSVVAVEGISAALRSGLETGVFPGAAAAVYLGGKRVHLSAVGQAQTTHEARPIEEETLFDLASVTKVVATTTAAVALVGAGELALDDCVVRFWPAFGRAGKRAVTVRQLLAHSSGLPAWKPVFLDVAKDPGGSPLFAEPRDPEKSAIACRRGRAMCFEAVADAELERPPGTQAVYSDLGFIALGKVIEEITGERLDHFVEQSLFVDLRLSSLGFRPLDRAPRPASSIAATGVFRPREPAPGQERLLPSPAPGTPPRPIPGEVDDDNAFAMGGVAGHAGLFGTASALGAWGNAVLRELAGAERIAHPEVWEQFATRDALPGSTRALGFDTPAAEGSSTGRFLASSRTIGHLGFTGTSIWLDLRRGLAIALLTNRVHPTRANEKIRQFRPRFHDAVVEALGLEEIHDQ